MSSSDLIWSLKNGDLESVIEQFESKKVDVNASLDGRSAIHYAADYGHTDIIEFLISKGVDLNAVDKHGISPLLAAIWEGHTECVRLMITSGAHKSGRTPDGQTYLEAAEKAEIKSLLK
ncbi:myotrophin-like [Oppia nitens]|uniref:myotrophin-like n=1 Tax=Oppia nitens TaxID=1686743 RepID=UPI0023DC2D83|nr:myotrophin-like [Oppia nitens]